MAKHPNSTVVFDRKLIGKYTNHANTHARRQRSWIGQEIGVIPVDDLFRKMELQNWACIYCECRITYDTCELDHVEPLSKGGAHYLYNVFFTCKTCNQIKKAKSLKVFCKTIHLDIDETRQKIADINHELHNICFKDETDDCTY